MYTTTSKQQESSRCKDSHLKCFITTNFDKFHRERVVNRSVVFPLNCLNIDRIISNHKTACCKTWTGPDWTGLDSKNMD